MSKSNTTQSDELRKKLCRVFHIFTDELELNLPNTVGVEEIQKLEELIHQDRTHLLQRLRDEGVKATTTHRVKQFGGRDEFVTSSELVVPVAIMDKLIAEMED